jgi:succinate dehydrogenase / fumarate reductase flavoprotein subunit
MEIGPTAHYIMGGVKVDPQTAMSTVNGLFAAGEVAAGLHGANRLGGNSLSDLVVFGQRAGAGAVDYVKSQRPEPKISPVEIDAAVTECLAFFEHKDGENPYALQRDVQEMMNNYVGIMRTEDELKQALVEIDALAARAGKVGVSGGRAYNPGWHVALDMRHILNVSRAIALAALERRESRGGHARSDFPGYDPKLSQINLVIRNEQNAMTVSQQSRPEMPAELKSLVEEA